MALYILVAEEQGVSLQQLSGTIQNDILKEFIVRNTYIYPPEPSMRIVSDIMSFVTKRMPRFNSISVSGYHMQEAGASPDLELAYTLGNGLAYVRAGLDAGLELDSFAPRMSFFFGVGVDFFSEIAKLRAARLLWAELIRDLAPNDARSMALRMHCQTSGWSLTAQDVYNNIVRTCVEALAATHGHTQSLHTNAYDEALALPTVDSARIARNTQLQLQQEAGVCGAIDPWGGSYHIERLTMRFTERAREHLREVEEAGGMIKAVTRGLPKIRIDEAAARIQAKIDRGDRVIVGVNKYASRQSDDVLLRRIDNEHVRGIQLRRLNELRTKRSEPKVTTTLHALTQCAERGDGNLLDRCLEAARAHATVGEMSEALEKVFGRHHPVTSVVSGVYTSAVGEERQELVEIRERVARFSIKTGRRPRILIAKVGQDGHDRGQRLVASVFADMGFDVDVGPLFQTAAEVARGALENDVHVVGLSSHAGAHMTLVPDLCAELSRQGGAHILVVVGGVVPPDDHAALHKAGVTTVFGPGH